MNVEMKELTVDVVGSCVLSEYYPNIGLWKTMYVVKVNNVWQAYEESFSISDIAQKRIVEILK